MPEPPCTGVGPGGSAGADSSTAARAALHAPLLGLVEGLAAAMDLVNPKLVNHHHRVAYVAARIAAAMDLDADEQRDLVLAALLHDSGGLSASERLEALRFELEFPTEHAETGFQLLRGFAPLARAATLIRYHHMWWEDGRGEEWAGEEVPLGGHLLHLADRVAVLVPKPEQVLTHADRIRRRIDGATGTIFHPEAVEAFQEASGAEVFWLDAANPSPVVGNCIDCFSDVKLDSGDLEQLAKVFCRLIDFRSHFTATHSSSVAVVAEALGRATGLSEPECSMMRIAGFLHDVGKLAVPREILEKKGALTRAEYDRVKAHTYYTYRILLNIPELEVVKEWASFHHEHLDGTGYPFRLSGDRLSPGARIMAVADIFTALTEDRPYRLGMAPPEALEILETMARNLEVDGTVVSTLCRCLDEIDHLRAGAEERAKLRYQASLGGSDPV